MLQEMMWEATAKECSINIDRSELWYVYLLAARAEDLEPGYFQAITKSDW